MSEDEDDLLHVAPGLPHSNILSETLAYVIGLALALILTGVSFWVASTGALWAPGVAVGLDRPDGRSPRLLPPHHQRS